MNDIHCEIFREDGKWCISLVLPKWVLDDIKLETSGLITFIQTDEPLSNRYFGAINETTLSLVLTSVSHVARIAEHEKEFNSLTFQDDAS